MNNRNEVKTLLNVKMNGLDKEIFKDEMKAMEVEVKNNEFYSNNQLLTTDELNELNDYLNENKEVAKRSKKRIADNIKKEFNEENSTLSIVL